MEKMSFSLVDPGMGSHCTVRYTGGEIELDCKQSVLIKSKYMGNMYSTLRTLFTLKNLDN
jgi:hypothetical protein